MTLESFHQPADPFSYLGVPTPAGMSDWDKCMSRTPIRRRNPEGVGRGKTTRRYREPTRDPINILLCDLGATMAILAIDPVRALRLRQLAELARPYTKTTQRRGQT